MVVYHVHHIVPRHMGGTDSPSNLVELSLEEHAEAHRILYEKYNNEFDRIAWLSLSGQINISEASRLAYIEGQKRGASNGGKVTGQRNKETGHIYELSSKNLEMINSSPKKTEWSSMGGKITGNKNNETGHSVRLAKLGAESRKGKVPYYNQELKSIKYFIIGEAPEGWVRGRK